jgi:hypothetical protein
MDEFSIRQDIDRAKRDLREAAGEDDHPYGPWGGGSKASGGGMMAKGGPDAQAKKLIDDATKAEPEITKLLQGVADKSGGRMEGLEHRLKEQPSLERKIRNDMEEKGISAGAAALGVNDHLRYTIVAKDASTYTAQYKDATAQLAAKGYKPLKPPKDFWNNGVPPPPVYQGVNGVFIHGKTGQRFELQFHTTQSLAAKGQTHAHFKVFGDSKDKAVRAREWKAMQDIQAAVKSPPGWPPGGYEFRTVG